MTDRNVLTKIARYYPRGPEGIEMIEDPIGAYVRWEDYEALRLKVDAMTALTGGCAHGPLHECPNCAPEPRAPHDHRWVLPVPPMDAAATNYFCGDCGFFPGPPVTKATEPGASSFAPIRRTVVDCPDGTDTCRRACTSECLRLSENRGGDREG